MKTFLTFPTAQCAMTISRTLVLWLMFPILCPITLFTQGESCDCPSGYDEIFIVGGIHRALAFDVFVTSKHVISNTNLNFAKHQLLIGAWVYKHCKFYK